MSLVLRRHTEPQDDSFNFISLAISAIQKVTGLDAGIMAE